MKMYSHFLKYAFSNFFFFFLLEVHRAFNLLICMQTSEMRKRNVSSVFSGLCVAARGLRCFLYLAVVPS